MNNLQININRAKKVYSTNVNNVHKHIHHILQSDKFFTYIRVGININIYKKVSVFKQVIHICVGK